MSKKLYMFDYNGKRVIVNDRKLEGLKTERPPANGYLNILILGDGYPYPFLSDVRIEEDYFREDFYKTREAIIKKLFNTSPFNDFWPLINIFSRFEASDSIGVGVNGPGYTYFNVEAHNWGPEDSNWHERKVEINQAHLINFYDYIKDLAFTGFGLSINGKDEWLTPGKKSFGFIGLIGFANHGGGQQHGIEEVQPNKYLSYFTAVGSSIEGIAETFVHELGHAFGLADEYDENEKERIDENTGACVDPKYLHHPRRPEIVPGSGGMLTLDPTPLKEPNVILRHELLPSLEEQFNDDRTKPLDANKMILSNNKFYPLMSTEDILWHTDPVKRYHVHPSWDPENNACSSDSADYNWVIDPDQIIIAEGASKYRRDIYRPNLTCLMRRETPEDDPDKPGKVIVAQFCKVCRFHIMKTLAEREHWSLGT